MNAIVSLLVLCMLQSTLAVTVKGNSTFDNQINKILHWDGTDYSSLGVGPEVIAGVAIGIGLTITFFGYRLIRPCIFVTGFIIGSVVFFLAAESIFSNSDSIEVICWVAFAIGGLLVGFLLVWLYYVGIFALGALSGVLLATQFHNSFGYLIYPSHPNVVLYILMGVFGLTLGLIALKIERPFLVFATSCIGAIAAVWGIGFFAGGYPNTAYLQNTYSNGHWDYDIPTNWWYYLAGMVVLCILGMIVQFQDLARVERMNQSNAAPAQDQYYVASATPKYGDPIRHRTFESSDKIILHEIASFSILILMTQFLQYILMLSMLHASTLAISVGGNSTFDNQINAILNWDGNYNSSLGLGPQAIAAITIGVGLIVTFLGYKLVRPCIFVAGFIIGSVAFFLLAERIFVNADYIVTACWIAFFVGGFIGGSLLVWLYKVGIFAIGALAGVLLATQIQTSFGYKLYPSSPTTVLIVLMVVLGIAMGVIALKLERPFLVFASSVVGAIAAVWGIGFFAGGYPNATNLNKTLSSDGSWVYSIPSSWWYYLFGTVLLCGLGVFVQFRALTKSRNQEANAMYAIPATPVRAMALSVPGNSTFDSQINQILNWDGSTTLGLGPNAVVAAAIAVGIIVTFFGYRLIRPVIFIAGFTIGSVSAFIAAEYALISKPYVVTACWAAFVLGGLVLGILLIWLYHIGLVAIGVLAGALLATIIQTSFGYKIYPEEPKVVLIILILTLGLLFGVLIIAFERPVLIFAMSVFGAVMITWGIGYFAGGYPNVANLPKHFRNGINVVEIPLSWWIYLAITFVICVLGMYFQFQSTTPKSRLLRRRY
ncbi:hypothetical protein THRCLA_11049, partial [Thraustotheca clavata]